VFDYGLQVSTQFDGQIYEGHMSILEINRLFYAPSENLNLLEKFNALTPLTNGWHEDMKRRIEGIYSTEFMRTL